jgi:hypothetical protein
MMTICEARQVEDALPFEACGGFGGSTTGATHEFFIMLAEAAVWVNSCSNVGIAIFTLK